MSVDSPLTPGKSADKPVIALLGEFSAGKSTLANVLLGAAQSPVRVTATQVPPIWYVQGTGAPVRVASDGTESDLPDTDLAALSLQDTRAVRVPLQAGILRHFSILDMPGSSDPNMAPDTWDALLPLADVVIWCTPATQAWRQSEAAIWDGIPEGVKARSLLVLTRMDKLGSPADRDRVLRRVARETAGQFRSMLPVSLLDALGPPERRGASGMRQVIDALKGILAETTGATGTAIGAAPADHPPEPKPVARIVPRRIEVHAVPQQCPSDSRPAREGARLE